MRQSVVTSAGDGCDGTVVCLGEALFDCLAKEKGVPREQVTGWMPFPGGAPANVAAALAKLGVRVAFVSALGRDELGDQMVDLLSGQGVDVGAVQRVERPTRDVLVVSDAGGDREFVGFGGPNDTFADTVIDAESLPEDVLAHASALVMGSLGLAFPATAAAMRRALEVAKRGTCSVLIDVNWRPVFWDGVENPRETIAPYIESADIVKLSEEEAEWLLDIPGSDALDHPCKVLERLPQAKGVLVTAGALGSAYCFRGAGGKLDLSGRVPVLRVSVQDTTGAGDAFLAGFLFSMVQAGGLEALRSDADKLCAAVEFATACGAFTTTKPGAIGAQPSEQQAKELLATAAFAASAA
ncbi:hypothetical protein WJX81_001140 [Elliptochloris bilobata]|uniref:Carbohydrate kinase PfkB domain-containing protein n=1 Tax=Elliptochloris bilobata TaxID=381761 RepID=A0AAW1RN14_9CHLO